MKHCCDDRCVGVYVSGEFDRNFGKLRREKGFTQEWFAEISGFTQQYVSDLERGLRNPAVVTLSHLANALGISHIDLVQPDDGARSERMKAPKRKARKLRFHQ